MSLDAIRSVRIGPFAAFDLLGTIGIALYIAKLKNVSPFVTIALAIALGTSVHLVLGIVTPGTELVVSGRA